MKIEKNLILTEFYSKPKYTKSIFDESISVFDEIFATLQSSEIKLNINNSYFLDSNDFLNTISKNPKAKIKLTLEIEEEKVTKKII